MYAVGQSSFVNMLHRESGNQSHPHRIGYAEGQRTNPPPDASHWAV